MLKTQKLAANTRVRYTFICPERKVVFVHNENDREPDIIWDTLYSPKTVKNLESIVKSMKKQQISSLLLEEGYVL